MKTSKAYYSLFIHLNARISEYFCYDHTSKTEVKLFMKVMQKLDFTAFPAICQLLTVRNFVLGVLTLPTPSLPPVNQLSVVSISQFLWKQKPALRRSFHKYALIARSDLRHTLLSAKSSHTIDRGQTALHSSLRTLQVLVQNRARMK